MAFAKYVRLADALIRPGGDEYKPRYDQLVREIGLEKAREYRIKMSEPRELGIEIITKIAEFMPPTVP